MTAAISDLAIGHAAEHLVCADLLLQGFNAFMADQVCAYDVAVDVGRLVRIQVKATRQPRPLPGRKTTYRMAYMWHVRRAGKHGRRTYGPNEFDLLALVAIDVRRTAYLPPSEQRQTVQIRSHDNPAPMHPGGKSGKTFDQFTFSNALREFLHV